MCELQRRNQVERQTIGFAADRPWRSFNNMSDSEQSRIPGDQYYISEAVVAQSSM